MINFKQVRVLLWKVRIWAHYFLILLVVHSVLLIKQIRSAIYSLRETVCPVSKVGMAVHGWASCAFNLRPHAFWGAYFPVWMSMDMLSKYRLAADSVQILRAFIQAHGGVLASKQSSLPVVRRFPLVARGPWPPHCMFELVFESELLLVLNHIKLLWIDSELWREFGLVPRIWLDHGLILALLVVLLPYLGGPMALRIFKIKIFSRLARLPLPRLKEGRDDWLVQNFRVVLWISVRTLRIDVHVLNCLTV